MATATMYVSAFAGDDADTTIKHCPRLHSTYDHYYDLRLTGITLTVCYEYDDGCNDYDD